VLGATFDDARNGVGMQSGDYRVWTVNAAKDRSGFHIGGKPAMPMARASADR